jgi:hypothetical protein
MRPDRTAPESPARLADPLLAPFTLGATLTASQLDEIRQATALLAESLERSPYADLERQHESFRRDLASVAGRIQAGPQHWQQVSTALDNLLAALRAFDDRTAHLLSLRYGSDSAQLRLFRTALAAEYDNNFAYRFCARLRNYSQHRGRPITNIRAGSRVASDGTVEDYFEPVFDSRALLNDFDGWGPVRRDLEAIDGEFPVEAFVEQMMFSCSRAHAQLLLFQEQELRDAAAVVRKFAEDPPGRTPMLVQFPATRTEHTNMTMTPIQVYLADNAEAALQQSRVILRGPIGETPT